MSKDEQTPFDSTKRGLVFALNAHQVDMPRPSMTVSMAEGVKQKKLTKKKQAALDALVDADGNPVSMAEPDRPMRVVGSGPSLPTGKDAALLAGRILQLLKRLDRPQQLVLSGLLIQSHKPCACRRPCCSGFEENARWSVVVRETCHLLQAEADVQRGTGKRGLGTAPIMRKAIVEKYFTKRAVTLVELAALGNCSIVTAAKHVGWITEYLILVENEAWVLIDLILNEAGITGTFTE